MAKAAKLPEAAQESLGLEILDYIAALDELRAEIQIGIDELDAGLGGSLDIDAMIRDLNHTYGER